MNLYFSREIRQHDALRGAYNALTEGTFGFSFEVWYRMGYWGDFHVPYALFDGGRAVANVSVNRMEVLYDGAVRRCFQLGTVMTDPAYRRRGLARRLMEEVLRDCRGEPPPRAAPAPRRRPRPPLRREKRRAPPFSGWTPCRRKRRRLP